MPHVALRHPGDEAVLVDGVDVIREVRSEPERVQHLAETVRMRQWLGAGTQAITDAFGSGLGGSNPGPPMATETWWPCAIHVPNIHCLSYIDEDHIIDTVEALEPETPLRIIASRSFAIQDTRVNAETAGPGSRASSKTSPSCRVSWSR